MKRKISEEEKDRIVVEQAKDNSAWDKPGRVRRPRSESLAIPGELAARAAFLARLHRQGRTEEWLTQIIRERVELEEAAFAGAKRELVAGPES